MSGEDYRCLTWFLPINEDVVMNTSDLLEQLLRAGQGSLSQQGGGAASTQGGLGDLGGLLGGLLGGSASGGAGGGGLGGLLGGLLGGCSPSGG